ncbi:MAG: M20/M25/M40 family metallo-hydrolase [Anaerolineales bacterium]|nr:M20/M25/M40 family metallo-hydrolase [Anaerolineales bacterium]
MAVSKAVKDKVLAQIREDDLIALSRELIKIPSETGQEKAVSDFTVSYMQNSLGMEAKGLAGAPDRPNAVGTWKGVGGGPLVQYSGHLDTVGPGDLSKWKTGPYDGEVIDGKIYGRGAMDSKGGGMASTLTAIKAIQKAGVKLKGDVLVVGTVDEEVGGRWGMGYLYENKLVNPDICIYCVHSDMEIKAHFKGIFWTKWTVRGQTAHGSMPHRGVNAIVRAARIIDELERNGGVSYTPHPILGKHTVNFGWFHAGPEYKYNIVSDEAVFGVDMRLIHGQSTAQADKELQELIARQAAKDPQLNVSYEVIQRHEPQSVSKDEYVMQLIINAASEIMGRKPAIGGTIAAGDLAPIFKAGKIGVGFGPGDLERGNAHKENEFLEIEQLVQCTQIYALTMLEACGVAE